jgi:hypothetical protein
MNFSGSASLKATILLALSVGTILFFNLYQRFVVTGPELLKDNQFIENFGEGSHAGYSLPVGTSGTGIASLHSENPLNIVDINQKVTNLGSYRLLRLTCDIKTFEIPYRQESWNTARVILVFYDYNKKPLYHLPHALVNISGTHDWEHYEGLFQVPPDASELQVSAQLAQTTGTMWVKNLSLRPLAESNSFHKLRSTAIIIWIAALVWITLPIVRSAFNHVHRTAIIALALIIAFGVLMPDSIKKSIGIMLVPSLSAASGPSITTTFRFTPLIPTLDIYKAGHFILFAALAAVSRFGNPFPASRAQTSAYLFLFALVTEVLQLFVSARSAQLGDVLIDCMGIMVGFLVLYAIRIMLPPQSIK